MVELLQKEEKEPILDHCGIIAAYITEDIPFFMTGVSGLKKLQTRGIDGAGVYARLSNGEILVHKGKGKIEEALNKEAIADLVHARAKIWLLQTRYGTNGSGNLENIQPIIRKHMDGSVFSIVHNGEFSSNRRGTNGESDTVCFANELAKSPQTSWDERILAAQRKSKGAWSLAVDTNSGLYLMRDELGIRPLSFGYKSVEGKKIWAASSETAGLSAMGMRDIKEVLPGQVIRINENGPKILQITNCEFSKMSTCIFENVYLGNGHSAIHRPRSTMVAINTEPTIKDFQRKCGQILASEENLITALDVDFAVGIPGTGIAGGRAYAEYLGIPYIQAISDKTPQERNLRTFMNPNIEEIPDKIKEHFYFEQNYLKGARIVAIDDSIVRANIAKGLNNELRKLGVVALHLRVLCPPIDKRCYLGINTRNKEELIAYRHKGDIEEMKKEIGVDSLAFLSDNGLLQASGRKEGFCLGCMVGHKPPIDNNGNITYER